MATQDELLLDPDIAERVASAKASHPGKRVRAIDTAGGVVICVHPSRAQFNIYMQMLWDDDKATNAKAHESLLRSCVVDPDPTAFAKILDEYAGISSDKDVVKEIRILAGAAKEDAAKK